MRELHHRVNRVRASEKIGVKYMQAWEEKCYWKQEAREEGLKEGREEGLEKGLKEGFKEKRYADLERAQEDADYRRELYKTYSI